MINEKKVARVIGLVLVPVGVIVSTFDVGWGGILWGGGVLIMALSFVPNFF